jgi:hypothetical protein
MGKQSSQPKAPDPAELARQQGIQDRKTQRLNLDASRTNSNNAFGSTSWSNAPTFDQAGFDAAMSAYKPAGADGTPGTGYAPDRSEFTHDNWTNNQTLNAGSQNIFDSATSKLQGVTDNMSTDSHAYNQEVADAIQRRMSRYTEPEMAKARNDMQTNLADRGFQVGNEGFNTEMTRLDNSQNMSRADVADRAQITGATQGQQDQSMQLQIAQALQGLRSAQAQGVGNMATTTGGAGTAQPFDISGAMMNNYTNQVNAANAQNASSNALLGSALGAGAMLLGGPPGTGSLLAGMTSSGGGSGTNPYVTGNTADMGGGTGLKARRFA